MIFVDTWAWVALADRTDQYHRAAAKQHRKHLKKRRRYITSDFVAAELIDYVYDAAPVAKAEPVIASLLQQVEAGLVQLVHVSPQQFQRAWQLRRKYKDQPDISFTDFTSMVIMQDLGITDIFTGDAHFRQAGLGFRLLP
jgi:predicted nucleic acid-binding protein